MSREGRRSQGEFCWVRYAPAENITTDVDPQIGYAIGRAVGPAVVRNRIRRRLRAIIADCSEEIVPGLYLVGVRNDRSASAVYSELQTDVRSLLRRAPLSTRG